MLSQIVMLYTLNLHSAVCQYYLNKTGRKNAILQMMANKAVFKTKIFPEYFVSSSFCCSEELSGTLSRPWAVIVQSQGYLARSPVLPQPSSPQMDPHGPCISFASPSRHLSGNCSWSQSENSCRSGPQGKELRPAFAVNKNL